MTSWRNGGAVGMLKYDVMKRARGRGGNGLKKRLTSLMYSPLFGVTYLNFWRVMPMLE